MNNMEENIDLLNFSDEKFGLTELVTQFIHLNVYTKQKIILISVKWVHLERN